MTTELVPAVWALFDRHDQDAAIAAALGLRRCANEHRCRGGDRWREDANELDRLADDLELIVEKVRAAWRESHPPGQRKRSATAACSDGPNEQVPGERQQGSSPRIVPGGPSSNTEGSP